MSRLSILIIFLFITGCSLSAGYLLDERYGKSTPQDRVVTQLPSDQIDYWTDVKPILDSRCVVCHSCNDAPCQLKLSAVEGINRGANKDKVYNGARILAASPSRLFEDAQSTSEWRQKGFHPVLNERSSTPEANINGSVLARILQLKQDNPLPFDDQVVDEFNLELDRSEQCSTIEEFDSYAKEHPSWGMPFALPALSSKEHHTIMRWLEEGATYRARDKLASEFTKKIKTWESFLNQDSLKAQLMSRYLYEHLFLAHFYFDDSQERKFFRMVRSKTPPGKPVEIISTRRPYEDPIVSRPYYRIVPIQTTIVAKTHLVYQLSDERINRYRELFLDANYSVEALPNYTSEVASHPFVAFQDIPVSSRYKFMLDESRFFVMGFIKGPVCRGQVALNAINDRFWIFFVNPELGVSTGSGDYLAEAQQDLRLPSEAGSNSLVLANWFKYSRLQNSYLERKGKYISEMFKQQQKLGINAIWDGGESNSNAALTIMRHYDSASVVKGLVGDDPKTAWVMGYPLFERLHYLLVAGYDIYANVGHQLNTRLYMDFLRMEGEFNFLSLLPKDSRQNIRDHWYRGASESVKEYIYGRRVYFDEESIINYTTDNPKIELFDMLRQRLGPVLDKKHLLDDVKEEFIRQEMQRLATVNGRSVSFLPQMSVINIVADQAQRRSGGSVFTLVNDSAHSNISPIFSDVNERLPEEDELTVLRGIVGAYPNVFFEIPFDQLASFVNVVANLGNEQDYQRLMDQFGVRRSDPDFWQHSDKIYAAYKVLDPVEAGLLDYNRLEK